MWTPCAGTCGGLPASALWRSPLWGCAARAELPLGWVRAQAQDVDVLQGFYETTLKWGQGLVGQ